MDPTTATTVLLVLGSAFGVMFATMTTLLVVSIRVQHQESINIRTEVGQQIEQAFDRLRVEFTEILDARFSVQDSRLDARFAVLESRFDVLESRFDVLESRFDVLESRVSALESSLADLRRTVEQNHQTAQRNHQATQRRLDRIDSDLTDIRERVARIEGHLGIGLYPQDPAAPDESDSDAA